MAVWALGCLVAPWAGWHRSTPSGILSTWMPSGSLGILTPLLIRKQKEMDKLCWMTEWESDNALESGTPIHNEVGLPQQSTKRNKTFKDSVISRPLILSRAAIVTWHLTKTGVRSQPWISWSSIVTRQLMLLYSKTLQSLGRQIDYNVILDCRLDGRYSNNTESCKVGPCLHVFDRRLTPSKPTKKEVILDCRLDGRYSNNAESCKVGPYLQILNRCLTPSKPTTTTTATISNRR